MTENVQEYTGKTFTAIAADGKGTESFWKTSDLTWTYRYHISHFHTRGTSDALLCMGVLIPATLLSHRLAEPCRSFRPESHTKGVRSPVSVGQVAQTSLTYVGCSIGLFHLPEPLG